VEPYLDEAYILLFLFHTHSCSLAPAYIHMQYIGGGIKIEL
jgi:hypothetical protein